MRFIKTICLLLVSSIAFSQEVNIIPKPVEIELKSKGSVFALNKNTVIVSVMLARKGNFNAKYLTEYLKKHYGLQLKNSYSQIDLQNKNVIELFLGWSDEAPKNEYDLTITKDKVVILADKPEAIFNGIQSLIQLLPIPNSKSPITQLSIPQLSINDYPRFQYRGMHLDCSRHFWSVEYVKQYIDYLALHKFNKFHWHLTDDQGWRIEIKKYPKLTAVGGWRNGTITGRYPGTGNDGLKYGGYYTQEQIKEVVKYAADRYIDVIPEIEMPGHASAAIAAYTELSCFPTEPTIKYFPKECKWSGDSTGKQVQQTWGVFDDVFCAGQEKTFKFLQDVTDEVLALFPYKIIHVGGDECPKENWKRCPHCQLRMKKNNLKDEHELQSYFIQRMEKYLNNKGRTLMGWDEILEGGLAPNAMVMSWRGENGGIEAAQQNHDVVMTPQNPMYFDHTQSENEDSVTIGGFNPIEKVYGYDPVPAVLSAEQAKHIQGAQANLWCEYIKNTKKLEYMIFPRMAALSEVLWSQKENKDWVDFEKRLMTQFKRYDLWKVNYSKAYFDLKTTVMPTEDYNVLNWTVLSKFKGGQFGLYKLDSVNYFKNGKPEKGGIHPIQDLKIDEINTGFKIIKSGKYMVSYVNNSDNSKKIFSQTEQQFHFNKATGKKITLGKQASKNYPGDGAFTLVNGVQNTKGMSKTKEFLGFSGEDCIATIDLGKEESISFVKVHYLHHPGSWIHQPAAISISVSNDGVNFSPVAISNPTIANNEAINEFLQPAKARYIKIHIANFGTIPVGNSGAGSKPWLFVDEIEVN
jgi:hexosaminidase